ncbi:hypothetical protein [Acinetobacter sp. MN12]|uniref:hypothetical protein n=1 Tax=Acinetobacter sp. MN12 TaxID=1513354 RepID=UPI00051B7937|nr:hypothetical protein [Acinetobacter sp. MN12]
MVQPYDYTLNVQNPSEVFTNSLWNGYKLGATMDQVKQQREQAALKQQQEQQRAEDTRSLIQNQSNENFTSFQLMYPDQAETIQKVWQQKSQGDKDFSWRVGSEALAALKSDSPDIAEQVFQKAAVHYDNSGRKQDAGSMRFYADLIKKNPANAKNLMQDYLSTVDRERFDKTFVPLNEQNRANQMQPYEIAKKEAETAKINAETNDIPLAAADRNQGVINQARGTELENQYKQQQLFFEKNKPVNFGVDKEGRKYAIMPNGDARYVKDAQGNYITDIKSEKPMTATMQKELFETDDAIASSQSVISNLKEALRLSPISYDGVNADMRASISGNLGLDKERSKNTAMLNNIMTSNALDALKSTFGAAPTEGERKILLDIQGSVNLPAKQREAIYTRALQAATKRLNTNQKKADAIRGGSYTSSEYSNSQAPQQQQAPKPVARSFFD